MVDLKQNLRQEYIAIIVVENLQGMIIQQENIKKQYCEEV